MTETPERTALYRIWGDGDLLLYIGISKDFGARWKRHAKQQPWWNEMRRLAADEWFDRREDAEDAEEAAIRSEGPKYNKRHALPAGRRPGRAGQAAAPCAVVAIRPAMSAPRHPMPEAGCKVPYPYSLLSFLLPGHGLGEVDPSTLEGRFRVAEALSTYERDAFEARSSIEQQIARVQELEQDEYMTWAVPTLGKIRRGLESLLGDGTVLADDAASMRRVATSLRRIAALMVKVSETGAIVADAMSARVRPRERVGVPPLDSGRGKGAVTAIVLRGDAAHLPLPDGSVDLICTSPPYWNLRDYRDGGESLKGQIGSEETPQEWLEALLDCTREWMRVLKPEGSIFVDLGDKYSARADSSASRSGRRDHAGCVAPARNSRSLGRAKSLLLLPERYRIGCVDQLDLIARAKIVWSKPTALPESAEDRVQTAHEDVVHLVKQPRYFSAVDEIRVPHSGNTHARRKDGRLSPKEAAAVSAGHRRGFLPENWENPLGKLPGSVWEIASVPLIVPEDLQADHFAAYPPELCRRIILGWSPVGICTECGEGRRPVSSSVRMLDGQPRDDLPAWADPAAPRRAPNGGVGHRRFATDRRLTGYACACPSPIAPTHPAVALDPFGGTGTTSLVADVLGRTGITVDRSADYCRLACWRTTDPGERARAMQVPKPPPVPEGQPSLFDEAI